MSTRSPLVIKIGGSVIGSLDAGWWDDAAAVSLRQQAVFVHGWSRPLRDLQQARGRQPVFLTDQNGHRSRLTDPGVLSEIAEVSGTLRALICAQLARRGARVLGLEAARDGLLQATVRPQRWWIDRRLQPVTNLVGPVRAVNAIALRSRLEQADALVITPLAYAAAHPRVNVDADRAAARIAAELSAPALVLVTDVDGVLVDGAPVRRLAPASLASIRGELDGGMRKKVAAAVAAVSDGVPLVVIGRAPVTDMVAGRAGTELSAGDFVPAAAPAAAPATAKVRGT
jgi:[amino group carrier protein]-L-2-aminoadipate/L-glutamate 6-kinase